MNTTLLIKIILMIAFFSEVVIFGKFISSMSCFKKGNIMSLAMTFSGTLFLSIAMLDIIPEAIASFDMYFAEIKTPLNSSSSIHQNEYLPLTMIIAMITFLIIMYIDKILIGHSHDHEYDVSFHSEPRKSQREIRDIEMGPMPAVQNIEERVVNNQEMVISPEQHISSSSSSSGNNNHNHNHTEQRNYRPFILQAGMSIHAFFQCLAVGLQKTPIGVLSLASAILVHKWAQGLTLGLIYRKEGFSDKISTLMVVFQGLINVLGLLTGTLLIGQGYFIVAFFMSISAGTFCYISLGEVLLEQLRQITKGKLLIMLLANAFLSLLVWFEKYGEAIAEAHQGD